MFQRLHSRAEYEGTGMGLAIVRKIVERHNGFIRANGVLGEGATFTLTFPISLLAESKQETESLLSTEDSKDSNPQESI